MFRRVVLRRWVLGSALCLGVVSAAAPSLALAQAAQRVVLGKVADNSNAPLKGAVVYLKDDHTLAVKSFIAGDDGGFRFGQLSQTTDYEIWAENAGKKSATRSISSFDSKSEITVNLTIK